MTLAPIPEDPEERRQEHRKCAEVVFANNVSGIISQHIGKALSDLQREGAKMIAASGMDVLYRTPVSMLTPSRFSGTPQEWDAYLSTVMAEDTKLAFYQWIGSRAVQEAVRDARRDLGNDPVPPEHRYYSPASVEEFLDAIDPTCDGGPYPSELPI